MIKPFILSNLTQGDINMIKAKLKPGAEIYIAGCNQAIHNSTQMQDFADKFGVTIYASSGYCTRRYETELGWVKFTPKH